MSGEQKARSRVLMRETFVSMIINAVISALFVFLVFGREEQVGLWGAGGLLLDFIPQTFVITFMATLVPSAIVRKALRKGSFGVSDTARVRLPHHLLARSLVVALVVSAAAVPLAVAALVLTCPDPIPFQRVLILKVAYGAALACFVTSFAVRLALRDRVAAQ